MDKMNFQEMVKRSHRRSESYGIELSRSISTKILKGQDLENRLEANRDLITVAKPYIEELYHFVKGTNFFLILTDQEGCILYMVGDDDNLGLAQENLMVPGAFMSEEHIGTNAMGTALAEEKSVQVTGSDHFVEAYHRWTCSGAVIRDPRGRIVGSLDMTGNKESVHSHTLGMVVSASNAIEKRIMLNASNQNLIEKNKFIQTLMNSMRDGFLSCNLTGDILTANHESMKMFGYSEYEMLKMNVSDLIDGFSEIRDTCLKNIQVQNEEMQINSKTNKRFFSMSAYPVIGGEEEITGCIFIFRDVKNVRRMANRIVGRRAIYTFDKIIGESRALLDAIQFAKKVSSSKSTVLLTGESGTGKEIFAHAIQNHSLRKEENFVIVNCASIPRNLIESELFGYVEGAFTGARRGGQPGKFEIADGGTIFLDEVGEMRLDMQARLLRVIQEAVVTRVGSNELINVDVRIIAATNKNLKEEVERGNFRLDLFYRLNVLPVRLPALRERVTDIPLLIEYFSNKISKKINKQPVAIRDLDMGELMHYDWPGNVRELENFVELMINTERVPTPINREFRKTDKADEEYETTMMTIEEIERDHIDHILNKCDHNITQAAKILGIGRNTLYRKLKKHGMECSEMAR
jgi:PAS domain S-box-containing protein